MMGVRKLSQIVICLLVMIGLSSGLSLAQEKKTIRMVFVSLAWNSEIPFRAALARGYVTIEG